MRLSELIVTIGKPATYYPSLCPMLGGLNATVFLCQLIYWTGKESEKDGWIYKSAADLTRETGLSYKEQKVARVALKKLKLIKEEYHRLDHLMFYKVDIDALNEKWESFNNEHCINNEVDGESVPCAKSEIGQCTKGTFPKVPKGCSGVTQGDVREQPQGTFVLLTKSTSNSTTDSKRTRASRSQRSKVASLPSSTSNNSPSVKEPSALCASDQALAADDRVKPLADDFVQRFKNFYLNFYGVPYIVNSEDRPTCYRFLKDNQEYKGMNMRLMCTAILSWVAVAREDERLKTRKPKLGMDKPWDDTYQIRGEITSISDICKNFTLIEKVLSKLKLSYASVDGWDHVIKLAKRWKIECEEDDDGEPPKNAK